METTVTNVMDERIVKLNGIIGIKLSSISSKKRPAVKAARELAKYILSNWDNEFELLKIKSEDVNNESIQDILSSRLQNFADAKEACEKAVKELEAPKSYKDVNGKEIKAGDFVKDLTIGLDDIVREVFSDEEEGGELAVNVDGTTIYLSEIKTDMLFEIVETPKEKKETKKADKEPKAAKTSSHKVGDVHKNGKWVWTEYAPGKFDWRTIPSKKQKTGAKPKNFEEKKETKKVEKASKGNAKRTKKAEPKKESPEAPKLLTIDEFKTMPKQARGGKKMSKAQEEAFKLIMKGYWIEVNHGPLGAEYAFFVNNSGDRKQCYLESIKALFKRFGLDYIPEGLVK